MSRYARDPKKFVLSVRINEIEKKQLQAASEKTGRDVSTLLRLGLNSVIKETQSD